MKKGKYRELVENVGLLSISNFTSKLLTFLLVPLYSRTLSQEEYGSIDIIQTTINLMVPILTLCINEAIIRFALDKSQNPSEILKIGLKITLKSSVIFAILGILTIVFGISKTYVILAILYYFTYSVNLLLNQFLKGNDQIKDLVVTGISNTAIVIVLNIIFLTYLKIGIIGYFASMIIANMITIIYNFVKVHIKKRWQEAKENKLLESEMKSYSVPMIFNSVAWWVNSAVNKYIVLGFCGVAQNGIFSMSNKIPAILMTIQNIFIQAWQISAVKEFNKKNSNEFFSIIYDIYNLIMVVGSAILILTTKLLAEFLYGQEFYEAWRYVPILLISVIFGALSGFIGTIFAATKNSKVYASSTIIGAVSNTVLGIALTYFIGVMGASIATLLSYFIVWVFRIKKSKQYIDLNINYKKHFLSYFCLLMQSIVLISEIKYNVIINIIITIFILVINIDTIKAILSKIKTFFKRGIK